MLWKGIFDWMSIHRHLLSPAKYNRPIWFQGNDVIFSCLPLSEIIQDFFKLHMLLQKGLKSGTFLAPRTHHHCVLAVSMPGRNCTLPHLRCRHQSGFSCFSAACLSSHINKQSWLSYLPAEVPSWAQMCLICWEIRTPGRQLFMSEKIACTDNSWKNLDMSKFPVPLSKILLLEGGFFLCGPRCVSMMDVSTGNLIQVHVFKATWPLCDSPLLSSHNVVMRNVNK